MFKPMSRHIVISVFDSIVELFLLFPLKSLQLDRKAGTTKTLSKALILPHFIKSVFFLCAPLKRLSITSFPYSHHRLKHIQYLYKHSITELYPTFSQDHG